MTWPSNSFVRDVDAGAGIEVTDAFEPFEQRNDIFTRAFWDDSVRSKVIDAFFASYRMEAIPRRGDGFTQKKDFALRNAFWLISDIVSERTAGEGRREGFQRRLPVTRPSRPTLWPWTTPAPWRARSNVLRDFSKSWHRLWLRLALSPLRQIALWLDRRRGGRTKPGDWWRQA